MTDPEAEAERERIETRAEDEVYICRRADLPYGQWLGTGAVYQKQGKHD